jgi:hypothetical protein
MTWHNVYCLIQQNKNSTVKRIFFISLEINIIVFQLARLALKLWIPASAVTSSMTLSLSLTGTVYIIHRDPGLGGSIW